LRSAWWYDLFICLGFTRGDVETPSPEYVDWGGSGLENPSGTVSCHHGPSCNPNTIPRWAVRMSLNRTTDRHEPKVTLRTLASHLNLAVGTISAALNDSPAARAIPDHTKRRILDAARELNYQPNYFARSLRLKRTYTIGVIAEQIGDPYGAMVISGIEEYLRQSQYFFLTVIHRHDRQVLQNYSKMLVTRGVEGFITVDTSITEKPMRPTVAVAGHAKVQGVTNIILDEKLAARLVLTHLLELGHRDIAFMKGQTDSSDSATRWEAICAACQELGVRIRPKLVVQIKDDLATPELGYPYAKGLLERKQPFTALFAYNDLSAIGAIWAFREAGLRVPEDISVVGFDDVPLAVFSNPGLTTIRQPLQRMGQIAAKSLIDQLEGKGKFQPEIVVEPELIVRASTGPAPRPMSKRVKPPLVRSVVSDGKSAGLGLANSIRPQDV
jgi:DNA-binding LacI/PurR family transcriptional regulator